VLLPKNPKKWGLLLDISDRRIVHTSDVERGVNPALHGTVKGKVGQGLCDNDIAVCHVNVNSGRFS